MTATLMLQHKWMMACMLTVGLDEPTWKFEIMSISRLMLIRNLVELMRSGISERSSARVQAETEVWMADEGAEKADNQT